jgi:photosystem II stability/assembly factor-like uncharacterized protein
MNRTTSLVLLLTLAGVGCSQSSKGSSSGSGGAGTSTGSTTSTSTTGSTSSATTTTPGVPWNATGIPVGGPYSAPGAGASATAPGVAILSLAVDPTAPATLYVEAYAQSALSLMKSPDGGQTWSTLATGTFDPGAVSVDATGDVFVSSDTGLAKSTDGGLTWTVVFPATSGTLGTLVVAPGSATVPATLYGLGDQLRSSIDGGATWTTLTGPSGFSQLSMLAVDPATPSILYAGANPVFAKGNPLSSGGTTPAQGGLFRSNDGGLTWQTLRSGQTDFYSGLALDAKSTIYAIDNPSSGGSPVLIESTDGGATWSSRALPATPVPTGSFLLVVDPRTPGDLYVGAVTAISRSTDGGATWVDASQGLGFDLVNQLGLLAMDPTASATLYAGGVQGGLFKTTTGGQ